MFKNKKIDFYLKYVPFLLCFFYALFLFKEGVQLSDDPFYKTDLQKYDSVWEWIKSFYNGWGGRIPLQILDIVFLNAPLIVWRVWNAFLYVMVPIGIYRLGTLMFPTMAEERKIVYNLALCLLVFFIPGPVSYTAMIWITGSFNYLLPGAMLLLGIYPFIALAVQKKCAIWEYVVGAIGIFFACYAEQTAAVFICMAVVCIGYAIYKRKRVAAVDIILFVFGIINAVILYAAPGNAIRNSAELVNYYPDFDMLSIMDKVVLGLIHILKQLFDVGYIYILVLILVLGAYTAKRSTFYKICYAGILTLTFVVHQVVIELPDRVVWEIYSYKMWLKIGILVFWIAVVAYFIFDFLYYRIEGSIIALLFLAVFATGVVIGLSPTIYASGERIFFASYLLLSVVIGMLLAEKFE